MIYLTDSAITHLRELLKSKSAEPGTGLRLQIERGGCAGMQYAMRLDRPVAGDEVFSREDVQVIVDSDSLALLNGSTLDYIDSLNDSGFRVENPQAARSCGCGTSFEPRKDG